MKGFKMGDFFLAILIIIVAYLTYNKVRND